MHRLSPSTLVRQILAVASGTAAGQVIVFAFSPLITRIYGPEAFGLQGIFLSLISILSPVIALRYPMAIVMADDEAEASRLSYLALLIAMAMAALIWLVLATGREHILALLGAQALGGLIWFLPVALFCVALQDVADFRAARARSFRLIGLVTVMQAFTTNLARVLGGLVASVAGALVAVTTFAPMVQAGLLLFGTRRFYVRTPPLRWAEAVALLRRHRDFPLYRMPTDVLSALAQTSPVLLLSLLFSPAVAGLYVLARSVVNLPLNVVGSAVGQVYYARFAAMAREGAALFPLALTSTLFHLLLLGGPLMLVALAFPTLFSIIFGEAWRASGEYAQWMVLWVVGMLANIPSVRLLPVIGRQRVHLLFNMLIMTGGIIGLVAGGTMHGTVSAAVAWYSVMTAFLYGVQIITYLLLARHHDRKTPA